jgi:hypothetical protein
MLQQALNLHSRLRQRYVPKSLQKGQAMAESLLAMLVLGLFLMGAQHLWHYGELRQKVQNASRFAAWERTVWEPEDNTVEKFAVHQTSTSLAKNVVLHQFSTPAAWRAHRANLQTGGTPAHTDGNQRRTQLHTVLRPFSAPGTDPDQLISVRTESGWTNGFERAFRGMDPTGGTTTSLELDRDTYRRTTTTFTSQPGPGLGQRLFSYLITPGSQQKHLALITNTWAASPPVMTVRAERQLLPFSAGHSGSGTKPNVLAFMGLRNDANAINAADFVGMVPWWNFVGGPNGLGGQYVVRQIGLDAGQANGIIQAAGQGWSFDPANPLTSLLLKPQKQQKEFFDGTSASSGGHRHTFVIDESADALAAKNSDIAARNSNNDKRKYRAISLHNPIEQYWSP